MRAVSAVSIRRTALLALAVLVGLVGGGSCGRQPPTSQVDSTYELVGSDFCDRLRIEELASSLDLTIPPWFEPSPNYDAAPSWRSASCDFTAVAEDDRFATATTDFIPHGIASVTVYRDADDAVQKYLSSARAYGKGSDHAARSTTGTVEGWWSQGMFLEPVWVHDRSILGAARSETNLTYVVQHRNLFLLVSMAAAFPTQETEEAVAEVHEILRAFIDEVAAHLTLSTE